MNRPDPKREEQFDFEKLIVYRKTMELLNLINFLKANPLDRAVDSVLLNVPEGNGYPVGSGKRRTHFRIALGSAKESASAVNVLRAKDPMPKTMGVRARGLLIEIVSMLEKMSRYGASPIDSSS